MSSLINDLQLRFGEEQGRANHNRVCSLATFEYKYFYAPARLSCFMVVDWFTLIIVRFADLSVEGPPMLQATRDYGLSQGFQLK